MRKKKPSARDSDVAASAKRSSNPSAASAPSTHSIGVPRALPLPGASFGPTSAQIVRASFWLEQPKPSAPLEPVDDDTLCHCAEALTSLSYYSTHGGTR
jgi:hypothetical protein